MSVVRLRVAKATIAALERELVQLRNELKEARESAAVYECDAAKSRIKVVDLENDLQTSQNELQHCKARVSSLESDLKERDTEIERMLAERLVLSQRFEFRYNCEALLAPGRMEEAAREFLNLLETFGVDEVMPEWVVDLQRRCVGNVVTLGDEALGSGDRARAIALYSSALSLKPADPVGILVKRSELYALQGLWADALADADEVIRLNPLLPQGYERKFIALRGLQEHDLKDVHVTGTAGT